MKIYLTILLSFLCYIAFGQDSLELKQILSDQFSSKVSNKENWIFYDEKAEIENLDNKFLKEYLPNFRVYVVSLIFKVRPDWKCRCLIFYDSKNKNLILQGPLSMNQLEPRLLNILKELSFKTTFKLYEFIEDFHKVRQIGSRYKFVEKSKSDSLISYDLVLFEGQDYITRPYKDTKDKDYKNGQIMAKFFIKVKDDRIIDYLELGPKSTY